MARPASDDSSQLESTPTARQATDSALVDRLRAGDDEAFSDLVRSWSPMMLRVARTYVSTDASAQEVVQEAWLAVIRGLDRFEGRSSLRTWVLAILANLGRTRGVREARTIPWSSLGPSETDGPAVGRDRFGGPDDAWPRNWTPVGAPRPWQPSPEDEAVARQVSGELSDALAELPERQRIVVSLRDVHGLSSDEVCSVLGVSAGNQRVLLHRARSRLRGHLEQHYATRPAGWGS